MRDVQRHATVMVHRITIVDCKQTIPKLMIAEDSNAPNPPLHHLTNISKNSPTSTEHSLDALLPAVPIF
jgi:hypothetical protein